jgi:hypothetical protein
MRQPLRNRSGLASWSTAQRQRLETGHLFWALEA